jgi:SAM-dependent methyltransferase
VTAEYFDEWYADIADSTARQQLFTKHLNLPEEVGPSNMVPLDGLRQIAEALSLAPGQVLVDLACGRGGPGMWIAREHATRLIGVDFSAVAVSQAGRRRALFGLADAAAEFLVGTLDSTGLPSGEADAVVCVDAFQFAADGARAAAEIHRVLRPGGHVVLTSWEPVDRSDPAVPDRIRAVDLAASLTAAGFRDVECVERPEWHEVARRLWQETLALEPGGDPALASMREEAERSVANHHRLRRVMATAVAR